MGRPRPEINADVIWKTTDDSNAMLPWVRATKLLQIARERRGARLAVEAEQIGNSMVTMIERLLCFADGQKDTVLSTQARGVPFRVQRSGTGLAFILERTQRIRPEPFSTLSKIVDRYQETKTLKPADYQDVTFNASYSLALLSLFLAAEKQR